MKRDTDPGHQTRLDEFTKIDFGLIDTNYSSSSSSSYMPGFRWGGGGHRGNVRVSADVNSLLEDAQKHLQDTLMTLLLSFGGGGGVEGKADTRVT